MNRGTIDRMTRDTGFPTVDAQYDYLRARRRHVLERLKSKARLHRRPDAALLDFDDVVDALGWVGGCDLGIQTIALDSLVGSVDRHEDFDRRFRPATVRVRPRFERIAEEQRRGRPLRPVEVLRVSTLHFVRDGHCEVAVAREHRRTTIEAHVVQVITRVPADATLTRSDLRRKQQERAFLERVPVGAEHLARLRLADATRYGSLADRAEAFGFRLMQGERRVIGRHEVAQRWLAEDYEPTVEQLRSARLVRRHESESEAYIRLAAPKAERAGETLLRLARRR
jgi:hypothetical protein